MNFKNKLFLAPMAGVTSVPFRELCRKYGADACVTEMVSANALVRNNKSTLQLLKFSEEERPIGVQLFGARTDILLEAAKKVQKDFDFIDINMGCPVAKVLKQGAGAALLKRKERVKEIVSELSAIDKPLTVKIRTGVDKNHINCVEIGESCEEAGASAIFLHARTVSQGYSGKADWSKIKELKEAVKIPVIGNGDIWNVFDAMRMYQETKCDSIMIGRGAIGNPFIFKEIKSFLKNEKEIPQANFHEKVSAFLTIQQRMPFKEAKAHALYFIKEVKNAARIRERVAKASSREELVEELKRATNIK